MKLRVLVFGAGAIGTYIGAHLLIGKHRVVFLERKKDQDDLAERGLKMKIGTDIHVFPCPELITDLDKIKGESYDLAILALKTYHLEEFLPELIRLKDHLPPILCLQNGIESEHILRENLGQELVIPGTVTTSVDRNLKGDIIVQKIRGVGIGGDHALVPDLIEGFTRSGLKIHHYSNPDDMKWSKLILNLLGNASAAILNMTPAEIFKYPRLFKLERQQVLETYAVMQRRGINVVDLPGIPVRLLINVFKYLPPILSQPILSKMIGGGRGEKMPSFHIDLHGGKGKSEIEHLNGAVVKAGRELGINTPVNKALTEILTKLINGEQPLDLYDHNSLKLLDCISH
jgi:2-dehydropantoate 2-reductase